MGKNSGRRGERFAHWHNAEARLCSCAQACRAWRRCHAAHSTAHVCDMDAAKRRLHSRGGRLSRHVGEGHREDLWAPLAGLYARTLVAHFVGEAWATGNERRTDEMTKCLNYSGGRDRDRTCDPYDVNVVLSR